MGSDFGLVLQRVTLQEYPARQSPDIWDILYGEVCTIPLALASAIVRVLHEQGYLELEAIGAGAIYRATTALTIARILLADDGHDLTFSPRFNEFVVDGEILAGLLFEVDYHPLAN